MADSDGAISADEFAGLLPLPAAIKLVLAVQGDAAYDSFMRRLVDGLVEAFAETRVVASANPTKFVPVPLASWKQLNDEGYLYSRDYWKTGDLETTFFPDRHRSLVFRYYNVRVRADGVFKIPGVTPPRAVEPPPAAPSPAEAVPTSNPKEPEAKGPPVSQAALKAWYEAFKLANTEDQDTEAAAMESARGCFPGRSFSRDDLRALRGARKRGRKPGSAK